MTASYWIEKLNLQPHPEGGFYRETYRCKEEIKTSEGQNRNTSTAIYFLLEGNNKSHFHKIKSDELWFFHQGTTIEIYVIENNELKVVHLGNNPDKGENFQVVIPANHWFAARLIDHNSFALVSCTVAPGFDFNDFELGKKSELKKEFPALEGILEEMTLD